MDFHIIALLQKVLWVKALSSTVDESAKCWHLGAHLAEIKVNIDDL